MTISQSDFESLDPKLHQIRDGRGRIWEVTNVCENQGGDVPGKIEVRLCLQGSSSTIFGWYNGQIIDEEMATDIDLNSPEAHVEPRERMSIVQLLKTCVPNQTLLRIKLTGTNFFYAQFLSLRPDELYFRYWRNDGATDWSIPTDGESLESLAIVGIREAVAGMNASLNPQPFTSASIE